MQEITLKTIGRVRNSIRKKKREGWESVISEVIIDPKYEEALEGVEDSPHLFFWLSRMLPRDKGRVLKIHPRSRLDLPLVGVFSTRTQYRPNPIGLTLVQLLKRKKIFSWYEDWSHKWDPRPGCLTYISPNRIFAEDPGSRVVLSPLGEAEKMTAVLNSKNRGCMGQTAWLTSGRFGRY